MRYDAFKRFIQRFIQRGALVPRFPLTRTLGPLGVTAAAAKWYLAGGISASACVGAYQAKGAASLAASYTNLANPGSHDLTLGTAPAWDATNGWKGGSSAYLKTDITPTGAAGTWSAAVRFSNGGGGYECLLGCWSAGATNRFGFQLANYAGKVEISNYSLKNWIHTKTSGAFVIAGTALYVDGALDPLVLGGGSSPGVPVYILALNNNGSPSSYTTSYIQALALYNTTLSAAQVAAVTTAMNAL